MKKQTAAQMAKEDYLKTFKSQEKNIIKTKDFLRNYDLWNKKDNCEINELNQLLKQFAY